MDQLSKEAVGSETQKIRVGKWDLSERTLDLSLRIVKIYRKLVNTDVGHVLGEQLLRSATSIGANYQEAQGAQSKADFISKVSIAYRKIFIGYG